MTGIGSCWIRFGLGLLSFSLWSRLWGRFVRLRRPRFLSRWMIRSFQRAYDIRMDDYSGEADDYPSLADFFVRPLDPAKRLLQADETHFLSPADGRLSRLQSLGKDDFLQVKGHTYPLSALLGETPDFPHPLSAATIYLAPFNYHRFHCPLSGVLTAAIHTGTRLFPVNSLSVSTIPRLFLRNERISAKIESQGKVLYFVAVGATFVGSIRMEFLSSPLPRNSWFPLNRPVAQTAEMGRFEQGSTIILVFPTAWAAEWLVAEGDAIRAGQPLFRFNR